MGLAGCHQRAHQLLDAERVALGQLVDRIHQPDGKLGAAERRGEHLERLVAIERGQRDLVHEARPAKLGQPGAQAGSASSRR